MLSGLYEDSGTATRTYAVLFFNLDGSSRGLHFIAVFIGSDNQHDVGILTDSESDVQNSHEERPEKSERLTPPIPPTLPMYICCLVPDIPAWYRVNPRQNRLQML